MTQPHRFLLATWDGGGVIPAQLSVARALISRGHEVHVLADPTVEESARAAGCAFTPWVKPPHRTGPDHFVWKDWEAKNPRENLAMLFDHLMAAPALDQAREVLALVAHWRPQVILGDPYMPGVFCAAEKADLPGVALMAQCYMRSAPNRPPVGPGLPLLDGPLGRLRNRALHSLFPLLLRPALAPVNAARHALDLAPIRSVFDVEDRLARVLVLTSPSFDVAPEPMPSNVRYVGPRLDDPTWAAEVALPWSDHDVRPLVVISLGSTFQDQADVLQRVVDATDPARQRVLVASGALEAAIVRTRGDQHVLRSAAHGPLLPRTALLVGNGGHGGTLKAMAAGVPMLVVPLGRDQKDVANRVVAAGAGLRVSKDAPVAAITDALERVLADGGYKRAAERLAATLAREAAAGDRAVAEIEAVAGGAAVRPAPRPVQADAVPVG